MIQGISDAFPWVLRHMLCVGHYLKSVTHWHQVTAKKSPLLSSFSLSGDKWFLRFLEIPKVYQAPWIIHPFKHSVISEVNGLWACSLSSLGGITRKGERGSAILSAHSPPSCPAALLWWSSIDAPPEKSSSCLQTRGSGWLSLSSVLKPLKTDTSLTTHIEVTFNCPPCLQPAWKGLPTEGAWYGVW